MIMGIPEVMTTDQGKEFHNQVNAELMKVFRIDHRMTTAYHPQANGLDERLNQTLINALSKFAQVNKDMWDEKLAEVIYSYNTAVQESSKHTPFEAMFGRMGRLPVDFNANKEFDADKKVQHFAASDEPDEEERSAKRRRTEAEVKANIAEAQRKQKQDYDRRHGAGSCYTVGAEVLKRDFTRKKRRGGKLDYRWQGPYVIIASLGKGLYRLKETHGERVSPNASTLSSE